MIISLYLYNQRPHYYKYIAEFPSIFSVYYNYTSVSSDLFRSILNLHRHFKYVKQLSNEKFLDIRELGENFLTYYKVPRYIDGKIGHFLASLFADSISFPYDIPWFGDISSEDIIFRYFQVMYCVAMSTRY